mmetsp:Transcript_29504/g.61482  ORF Transcript_29504/g.61482 Transcript_29504/m.61482 type:complete len:218 (-) Transcript_29504:569-1222(-)
MRATATGTERDNERSTREGTGGFASPAETRTQNRHGSETGVVHALCLVVVVVAFGPRVTKCAVLRCVALRCVALRCVAIRCYGTTPCHRNRCRHRRRNHPGGSSSCRRCCHRRLYCCGRCRRRRLPVAGFAAEGRPPLPPRARGPYGLPGRQCPGAAARSSIREGLKKKLCTRQRTSDAKARTGLFRTKTETAAATNPRCCCGSPPSLSLMSLLLLL